MMSRFQEVTANLSSKTQKGKKEKRHKRKKSKKAKGGEDNSGPVQISKVAVCVVARWTKCTSLYFTFKRLHFFSSLSVSEGPGKGEVQHDIREEDQDESEEVKERQTGEPPNVSLHCVNGLRDSVLTLAFDPQRDKNRAELLEFLNSTL